MINIMKRTKLMQRIFSAQENQEDEVLNQFTTDIEIAKEDGKLDTEEYSIISDEDGIDIYDNVNDEVTRVTESEGEFVMEPGLKEEDERIPDNATTFAEKYQTEFSEDTIFILGTDEQFKYGEFTYKVSTEYAAKEKLKYLKTKSSEAKIKSFKNRNEFDKWKETQRSFSSNLRNFSSKYQKMFDNIQQGVYVNLISPSTHEAGKEFRTEAEAKEWAETIRDVNNKKVKYELIPFNNLEELGQLKIKKNLVDRTMSNLRNFSAKYQKIFANTYKEELNKIKAAHRARLEKIDKRREEIQKEIDKLVDERKNANNWLDDEEERISKKYNK